MEEKGIFVTIRFWTDFDEGILPKKAWAAGTLTVRASKTHGIKSSNPVMFNNLEEFMVKLDEVLRNHGITLYIKDSGGKLTPRLGAEYPKWTWTGIKSSKRK